MRILLVVFLSVINMKTFAQSQMEWVRKAYVQATNSEKANDALLKELDNLTQQAPIFMAYRAACEGLQAKYVFNPYKKVMYVKQAQKLFSTAVQNSPQNIEVRFLRFSMEHNLPSFLGLSAHLQDDIQTIIINFDTEENLQIDTATRQLIGSFLLNSGRCTTSQIKVLKK